ncbi:MAG: copper amine oxidase N-terminal domain-containing protein [Bacillota bacterium]|nr:copper amine oxidase N-terminal domain-containing protein [Bacillota bacterium]
MILRFISVALGLILAVAALPAVPALAQTVRVVVDGQLMRFDQSPIVAGGRVLVPLRGVFEYLGATVLWNPATNVVTAQRGDTQVQLAIGSRQATVDGRVVFLDVPATIVGGRTLVPLRFVSEAMGAQVDWDNATRVVTITSGTTALPVQPPARVPRRTPVPQQPAPVAPSVVEGRVLRVDGQRILVEENGVIRTFTLTSDTTFTALDVGTGRSDTISPDQIRPGDVVRVTADNAGRAILVRVSVRTVSGRIDAITSRSIALSDGQVFTFADGVRFIVNGQEATREQLRVGMEVVLRLNPQTSQVLVAQTRASGVQPPAPPAGNVQITSFSHNATAPLRAGSRLTVTLRGTPGGTASFDIFGVDSDVAMRQVSPGVYQGIYTVRTQDNVGTAVVVGRLRVGGQEAPLVQAGTRVTLDGTAPQIVQRFPEKGQTVNNVRPNILIVFNDTGSGIDPARSRLFVNGQNVTARVSITETALAYSPPEALAGRVLVRVILADKAGNVTDEEYTFTTAVSRTSLIHSVTVSPTTPLRARDVLTVRMLGEPGGQASFTIEGVEENIPMAEAANQRGVYVGSHTIQRREQGAAQNARIIVRLTKDGVTSQAAVARLMVVPTEGVAPPVITSPAAGTRLASPIVIRGKATPGYRVEVQVDYQGALLVFGLKGTYGKVMTTADAAGDWAVSLNTTVRISNAELTITAVTIDPLGRRSEAVTIRATLARVWPYPWQEGNAIVRMSEEPNYKSS